MLKFDLYSFASLLSAVVIFFMGVCLIVMAVPKDMQLGSYRLSRRFLAIAYLFLSGIQIISVLVNEQGCLNRIIPFFQAMMFTFALIALINHRFLTRRRLSYQLFLFSAFAAMVLVNKYLLGEHHHVLSWMVHVGYFSLFTYYVWIFVLEYRRYKNNIEISEAANEHKRLKWVAQVFVIAAIIGILAGVLKRNSVYFLVFITFYTILYAYMVIRYINYVHVFHYFAHIINAGHADGQKSGGRYGNLNESVRQWKELKKYLSCDTTLESLARELNTNRFYLSRYINSEFGQNFRSWINTMRIEEGIKIMERDHDIPIPEIAENIGMSSINTFYRHFTSITGTSPQRYRNRFTNSSE